MLEDVAVIFKDSESCHLYLELDICLQEVEVIGRSVLI